MFLHHVRRSRTLTTAAMWLWDPSASKRCTHSFGDAESRCATPWLLSAQRCSSRGDFGVQDLQHWHLLPSGCFVQPAARSRWDPAHC